MNWLEEPCAEPTHILDFVEQRPFLQALTWTSVPGITLRYAAAMHSGIECAYATV